MNPVKHDASSIAPVPIESSREIVVSSFVELIEIQIRVARFQFPCTGAYGTRHDKEIRRWNTAAELSSMLSESFIDAILTR